MFERREHDSFAYRFDDDTLASVLIPLREFPPMFLHARITVEAETFDVFKRSDIKRRVRPVAGQKGVREKPIAPLQHHVSRLKLRAQFDYLRGFDQRLSAAWFAHF